MCLNVNAQENSGEPISFEFINGHWFDGNTFITETFYSNKGVLSKTRPEGPIETVDLKSGYVVPPFAEAHNHNVGGGIYFNRENNERLIRQYLTDGVFYVKIPGNPAENAKLLRRELIDRPRSVDVSFSNAVLTSNDGHPIGMTLSSFKQANLEVPEVSQLEGKVYYIIEGEEDLMQKWDQIMKDKPDFIKVILRFTDYYEQRRQNPKLFGRNGLNRKLVSKIVKMVHGAGLRVAAHIDTASDFEAAVQAGVDEINHLPGSSLFEPGTKEKDFLITGKMARQAAHKNIFVVSTTGLAKFYASNDSLHKIQDIQRKNLKILKRYKVKLALGSDNFMDTSRNEALYLNSLKVFTNLELLKMWCEVTPQTIFPNRKIGRLAEGYEASFLVLENNPLKSFQNIDIRLRYKQGTRMEVRE